jgi:hypothetical protein
MFVFMFYESGLTLHLPQAASCALQDYPLPYIKTEIYIELVVSSEIVESFIWKGFLVVITFYPVRRERYGL